MFERKLTPFETTLCYSKTEQKTYRYKKCDWLDLKAVVVEKVEIVKLSKLWIVAGVLLLTACQSEQTPTGSRGVSIGTTVAEVE